MAVLLFSLTFHECNSKTENMPIPVAALFKGKHYMQRKDWFVPPAQTTRYPFTADPCVSSLWYESKTGLELAFSEL